LPRRRVTSRIVFVCAAALTVAGCSGATRVFEGAGENLFAKPIDVFAKPDWARPTTHKSDLGPKGAVGPEELVGADGSCAPAAEAAPAPAAAAAPATSEPVPDRLETGGAVPAAAPPVLGGISLGMSECQAVRRAGQPANVAISSDEKGERKVVVTYLSGPWPGIYTFNAGRLKVIDRAPELEKPKAPVKKKKPQKRG